MNRKQLGLALFVGGPFLALLTWRPPSAPKPDWDAQEANSALLTPARAGSGHQAGRGVADDTLGRWERRFRGSVNRSGGTLQRARTQARRRCARRQAGPRIVFDDLVDARRLRGPGQQFPTLQVGPGWCRWPGF